MDRFVGLALATFAFTAAAMALTVLTVERLSQKR